LGQTVRLIKDKSETDPYGRLLRYVYLGDLFINAELVRLGYAEAVEYRLDTAQADYLESLEAQARADNLNCHATGVFADDSATPDPLPTQPIEGYRCPDGSACIKGNVNSAGDKIYHYPGCGNYDEVAINESQGERFFVTAAEAEAAGWRRAKNCP
jgi:micrococcal nuclease